MSKDELEKRYSELLPKIKSHQETEAELEEWFDICDRLLEEIMLENCDVFKRLKYR